MGARQAGQGWAWGLRGGRAPCSGARLGQAMVAPFVEQGVEAGGEAGEAVPEEGPGGVREWGELPGRAERDMGLGAEPDDLCHARLAGQEAADGGLELDDDPGEFLGDG